jgi:hypothetical protein
MRGAFFGAEGPRACNGAIGWACSGEGSRGIQNDQGVGGYRVVVVIPREPNDKRKDEDEK